MALFPLMQKYHPQLSCNLNTHIHTPSQMRTHLNTRFLLHKSTSVVLNSQSQCVISPKVINCDSFFNIQQESCSPLLTTYSSTHTHSYTHTTSRTAFSGFLECQDFRILSSRTEQMLQEVLANRWPHLALLHLLLSVALKDCVTSCIFSLKTVQPCDRSASCRRFLKAGHTVAPLGSCCNCWCCWEPSCLALFLSVLLLHMETHSTVSPWSACL